MGPLPLKASKTKATRDRRSSKSDDSGIMEELDNMSTSLSSTSSTATASNSTTTYKVRRIHNLAVRRRRMQSIFPQQATYDQYTVSMGKKLVKKAINAFKRMEENQIRRQRHIQLLQQLCQDPKDEQNHDDTKREENEEPPPRPPTRRCMFYREDTDVVKVLRAKQI